MTRIKKIKDVVDWGLCVGCGGCFYACPKNAVKLADKESYGIRPQFDEEKCKGCSECLATCPGYFVNGRPSKENTVDGADILLGRMEALYEGHARDDEIRFRGASGGALTALALYCLEKEGMELVLHTAMDAERPWRNATVQSRSRKDLVSRTGSRYAPSSPCEGLARIEEASGPCVFIGKPCDVGAVSLLRSVRPKLDEKLGLVLTMFCAGTPSTMGTMQLLNMLGVDRQDAKEIRYRGSGWPGKFKVETAQGESHSLTYKESWGKANKFRPFRCHFCPDGLGETADIACGDAWHRFKDDGDVGRSLVMARTERGNEIVKKAIQASYLDLDVAQPADVLSSQGLLERRGEVFGRLMAMKMIMVPTPRYSGFPLGKAWWKNDTEKKIRSVLGTFKRVMQRGLWHKNPLF